MGFNSGFKGLSQLIIIYSGVNSETARQLGKWSTNNNIGCAVLFFETYLKAKR